MHTAHSSEGELTNFFLGFHRICCHTVQTVFCKRCCGRKQLWPTFSHGYMTTSRTNDKPWCHRSLCYFSSTTWISLSVFSFPSMLAPMTVSGSAPAMALNEADSVWEAVSQLFGKIACFLLFLHQACMFSCNQPPSLLAEWPGFFTCYCGNAVVKRIPKSEPAQRVERGEKERKKRKKSAAPAGNRTRDLGVTTELSQLPMHTKAEGSQKEKKKEKTRVW